MIRTRVSLPEDLGDRVKAQAVKEGYSDAAAYVCELMRRDRDDAEKLARLQAAIDEGRRSGVSDRDPFEHPAELRAGPERV